MSLECGIVGLPNVGKSTLFNTLTKSAVPAENFPFCTVDPHKGIVMVPDPRLQDLEKIVEPEKVTSATVSFVDIAGLVKGAAQGEGLGNQFLSHIREVNAITHVVRCFEDPNIVHVMGGVDPARDVEIIDMELCLSDLDSLGKRKEKAEKQARAGDAGAKKMVETLKFLGNELGKGIPLRKHRNILSEFGLDGFLTSKPVIFVANISEDDVRSPSPKTDEALKKLEEVAASQNAQILPLSVALEYQLSQLSADDAAAFASEYGLLEPGLNRLIREVYKLLGLQTYFTAGKKEVRAWTIRKGARAPEAAGVIHSDFERGFIRAEVIGFKDYLAYKGEKGARDKGVMRSEGKEYEVQDGDVILFRFNV